MVAGQPLVQEYVFTCGGPIVGTLLERDPRTGARLYRTDGVVRFVGRPAVCPGGRADSDDDES